MSVGKAETAVETLERSLNTHQSDLKDEEQKINWHEKLLSRHRQNAENHRTTIVGIMRALRILKSMPDLNEEQES